MERGRKKGVPGISVLKDFPGNPFKFG